MTATVRFEQRIYALEQLLPHRPTAGGMRLAGDGDRALAIGWTREFTAEAMHQDDADTERIERSVDARLDSASPGGIGLWEVDGKPVSLAGFGGPTPNGIRIGPVYTPPEHRGHGYGTAVTAAVSRLLLDRGVRFCFLYTDLANPTSNADLPADRVRARLRLAGARVPPGRGGLTRDAGSEMVAAMDFVSRYAELAVRVGANVQPGQKLVLVGEPEHALAAPRARRGRVAGRGR